MKYLIIKDKKKRKNVIKFELRQLVLKSLIKENFNTSHLYKEMPNFFFSQKYFLFDNLKKNSLKACIIRIRNRCIFTGHPRSISRYYRMSRIVLRLFVSNGQIFGLAKASW